jgi:biopolymer transport protein ExbB/TolQ
MLDILQIFAGLNIWALLLLLGIRWYKRYLDVKEFKKWFGEEPVTNPELQTAHAVLVKSKISSLALEFQRADNEQRNVVDHQPHGNKVSSNQANDYYSKVLTAKAELEFRKSNFWHAVNIAIKFGYFIPNKLDGYLM